MGARTALHKAGSEQVQGTEAALEKPPSHYVPPQYVFCRFSSKKLSQIGTLSRVVACAVAQNNGWRCCYALGLQGSVVVANTGIAVKKPL